MIWDNYGSYVKTIYRLKKISLSSQRMIAGDSARYYLLPGTPTHPYMFFDGIRRDPPRHRGRYGVIFYDGHVQTLNSAKCWLALTDPAMLQ
jgi:prepilin-type processing-associated H-X9-DG protein